MTVRSCAKTPESIKMLFGMQPSVRMRMFEGDMCQIKSLYYAAHIVGSFILYINTSLVAVS